MTISPAFIGVQRFLIKCMFNGTLLHPMWAYVDEWIYLVHQLPFYSVNVIMSNDDLRNTKGHSLTVMTL